MGPEGRKTPLCFVLEKSQSDQSGGREAKRRPAPQHTSRPAGSSAEQRTCGADLTRSHPVLTRRATDRQEITLLSALKVQTQFQVTHESDGFIEVSLSLSPRPAERLLTECSMFIFCQVDPQKKNSDVKLVDF